MKYVNLNYTLDMEIVDFCLAPSHIVKICMRKEQKLP